MIRRRVLLNEELPPPPEWAFRYVNTDIYEEEWVDIQDVNFSEDFVLEAYVTVKSTLEPSTSDSISTVPFTLFTANDKWIGGFTFFEKHPTVTSYNNTIYNVYNYYNSATSSVRREPKLTEQTNYYNVPYFLRIEYKKSEKKLTQLLRNVNSGVEKTDVYTGTNPFWNFIGTYKMRVSANVVGYRSILDMDLKIYQSL